ncbi:ABC-three component system protein [Streptococcus agalactiae]|uniref:ABC-three component system protein n=1 Tax=Streptococcus agalactiae TaxID=1311 RepID=UPI0039C6632C
MAISGHLSDPQTIEGVHGSFPYRYDLVAILYKNLNLYLGDDLSQLQQQSDQNYHCAVLYSQDTDSRLDEILLEFLRYHLAHLNYRQYLGLE